MRRDRTVISLGGFAAGPLLRGSVTLTEMAITSTAFLGMPIGYGKMPDHQPTRRGWRIVGRTATTEAADFSDLASQRVLTVAAEAVAYELGRQAAREQFAGWSTQQGQPA